VIRALAAERRTMVIVTHEMGFARDVATASFLWTAGVIVEQGGSAQIIDNSAKRADKGLSGEVRPVSVSA
jgi:cystine transport system ATP-binding protein